MVVLKNIELNSIQFNCGSSCNRTNKEKLNVTSCHVWQYDYYSDLRCDISSKT